MFKELNRGKKTVREGIDTKTMDFAPLKNLALFSAIILLSFLHKQ